jgi:hypothetical protein
MADHNETPAYDEVQHFDQPRDEGEEPLPEEGEDVPLHTTASMDAARDESLGGLLRQGIDIRKVHHEDEDPEMLAALTSKDKETKENARKRLRRKGAWRGIKFSELASISFAHAERTFDFKIRSLILGGELRLYILFMIMFCIFFLVERDISGNYYFAKAFKDPLLGSEIAKLKVNRPFPEIQEAADFNDWAIDVFLIQNIDPAYPTGNSWFVGAFRFRTHRVRKDSCEINNAIIPKTMPDAALECYGDWSEENADDGSADNAYNKVWARTYTPCVNMEGGTSITGQMARYDCGGYHFEVPWWRPTLNATLSDVLPTPSQLFERMPKDVTQNLYVVPNLYNNPPFIDNLATRFVVAEFFAFQEEIGNFFSFKLYAEVAAGGLWYTDYQARVFDIWTPSSAKVAKTVYDAFFLLFVLYYLFRFVYDLVQFYKREGKILAFFFNTWNLLELANVTIFLVVFGFKIAWMAKCSQADIKLEELTFSDKYPAQLDDILNLYMFQIYLNSVNTVLSFLKLLKYFRLNDRLNVLTRTLGESQDSIIGVLLIFFLVVTAFAMTGHGLFGLGVWAFRSVDSSYSTLLLMLVGQFDYKAMKNENRVLAGFFFWAYIILGLFCLLNFLIGVLMEAFAEVSQSRTVLPLESILVKTFEDLKKLCHPTNLKRMLLQSCGESRSELLEKALECLKTYRLQLYPASDTVNDLDREELTRLRFLQSMPEELRAKIGEEYLDYVWNDLVYEWDQSEGAQEAIDAHRNLAMTARGVHQAIGAQMEILETLPGRLAKLEQDLQRVAKLLGHVETEGHTNK